MTSDVQFLAILSFVLSDTHLPRQHDITHAHLATGWLSEFPPNFYTSTMVAAAPPFTGNAYQLLDLQRESLARFEAVTLTQLLVNGRKPLSLFIEVPVDNARRRRPDFRHQF